MPTDLVVCGRNSHLRRVRFCMSSASGQGRDDKHRVWRLNLPNTDVGRLRKLMSSMDMQSTADPVLCIGNDVTSV